MGDFLKEIGSGSETPESYWDSFDHDLSLTALAISESAFLSSAESRS